MKTIKWNLVLLLLPVLLAGCTHIEKFRAVEGDIETPYESLGTLEVHLNTNPWNPSNWGWDLREILTLSFWDTSYPRRLQHELAIKAKRHPEVDQVIKVTYWPTETSHFPDGKVYGRGEMIRYKRFPGSPAPAPAES